MSAEIVNYMSNIERTDRKKGEDVEFTERAESNVDRTERTQSEEIREGIEVRRSSNNVLETRKGEVRQWSELSYYLPEEIDPHHTRFLKKYFKAQLRIAEGQRVRAKEIFDGLVNKKGYEEFEERNQPLLAAIDIVVRGSTNRKPKGGPGFRVGKR